MVPDFFRPWCCRLINRKLKHETTLRCPACGEPLPAPARVTEALWDMTVGCQPCGFHCSLLAAGFAGMDVSTPEDPPPVPSQLPPDSIISVSQGPDLQEWDIPAKRGWNGFIGFSLFWLGLCSLFILGLSRTKSWHYGTNIGLPIMLGIFVLAGLGMLYAGLAASWMRHHLAIRGNALYYRRDFPGRTARLAFPLHSIESVELKEFYQQNYQPIAGIEIRSPHGKIRFGSQLTQVEKQVLAAQLKAALLPPAAPAAPPPAPAEPPPAAPESPAPAAPPSATEPSLETESTAPLENVRIESPARWSKPPVIIGSILTILAGIMLKSSLAMLFRDWQGGHFNIGTIFMLVWSTGPLLLGSTGLLLLFIAWRLSRISRLLEVNRHVAKCTETTRRRIIIDTLLPHEIQDITVVRTGKLNTHPVYRGEIVLSGRVIPFGYRRPQRELTALTAQMKRLLNK